MNSSFSRVAAIAVSLAALAACSPSESTNTAAGAAAPPAADLAALTAQVGDAVWRVDTEGCGWLGSGSAFAIDRRHLVTNNHVTANDTSPVVQSRRGKRLAGRVVGATREPDIAVIEVSEDLPVTVPWAPTSGLLERESLVLFGYPRPAKAFRASSGSIVSFKGGREAALSDAPVERGSSGGPAMRADATVAGVVTRMSLPADPSERVAIIFTADLVRATVEEVLRKPRQVLSECGLGPDYVPPVPTRYDIKDAPAPPPQPAVSIDVPVAAAPTTATPQAESPTPTVAAPRGPTTSTVPCPSGRAVTWVDKMTATKANDPPDWWNVVVDGFIRNDGTSQISFDWIDVTIEGEPPRAAKGFPDTRTLAPGESTRWQAGDSTHSPRGEPTRASAELSWDWTDRRFGGCPSD